MPPSNSVSLVPRSGVLEYQGPPPLSVVTSTRLLFHSGLSLRSTSTLCSARSRLRTRLEESYTCSLHLASTRSRVSCGLSGRSDRRRSLLYIVRNLHINN